MAAVPPPAAFFLAAFFEHDRGEWTAPALGRAESILRGSRLACFDNIFGVGTRRAGAKYFYHRSSRMKPQLRLRLGETLPQSAVFDFLHISTVPTNKKLTGVFVLRVIAGDECVQGLQSMNQMLVEQEFKRTINRRRRNLSPLGVHHIEQVICRHRSLRAGQQLKHMRPLRRQTSTTFVALMGSHF